MKLSDFDTTNVGRNMKLHSILFSSKGFERSSNEDNFCFDSKINNTQNDIFLESFSQKTDSFAVFDGMGGLSDGYNASRISAQLFSEGFSSSEKMSVAYLSNLYNMANNSLCNYMLDKKSTRIGTTVVTLSIYENKVIYSNIGDSKLYRIRDKKLTQLSKDHTEIQFLLSEGFISSDQAKTHPSKNKLTQHLGIFSNEFQIDPFIEEESTVEGDIYILATDGVTNYFENEDLLILFESLDNKIVSDKIIEIVLNNGASDNFTFIIVKLEEV